MSCPDCFSGTVHLGTPTGSISTIHSLPTYVSSPPDGAVPKGVIVMIPDAFGWDFVNNRLLCDKYAAKGFLVYLPDFMDGHSAPVTFVDLMENKIRAPASWFTTIFFKPFYILKAASMIVPWLFHNRVAVCKPRIFKFFTQLRLSPPPTTSGKLGAAGFCWGGYYAFQLAHDDPKTHVTTTTTTTPSTTPLVDAAYTAHPSMLKLPDDIAKVSTTIPLSVVVGDCDHAMAMPAIENMRAILDGINKKCTDGDGGLHEVTVLKGAKHGFAIRLDPKDEVQNACAEEAERLAVEWFTRWLV